MGIGRRNFIKLAALALTGLAIDPLKSVITNNNYYVNKKLGILFKIPEKWGFVKLKDFGKLKEEQILNDFFEPIKEEVHKDLGDPICIATKYYEDLPKYKGVFSPTITLHITHKSELEDIDFENFEELMKASEQGVSMILKDFNVIKRYKPYYISKCKFYEYDAEYLFEHIELEVPIKVNLKVIKAKHNNYYYDFNCHQTKEVNQIANNEFEDFKKSIKLI